VLYSHLGVKLDGIGYQVRVEFVEALVEESGEVAGQLVRFLQAGPQPVGERRDVGHVHVLGQFGFFLHGSFELSVAVLEQPLEYRLLDLLVVLLLEELVFQEGHGAQDKELALFWTHVESCYWTICRVTDRA